LYRQNNNLVTTECHSSCQRQTQLTAAIKAFKAAEMSVAHSDRRYHHKMSTYVKILDSLRLRH